MHGPASDEDDGAIAQINIIPLVDVVLVLLIIFMVTTVFTKSNALDLDLPQGARSKQKSQPPVEITVEVDKDAHIFVNGQATKLKDIKDRINSLRNASKKTVLVLRGDKKTLYENIMPVLDEVSRTGVDITLALKPGGEK
ncbi:MAG: ExbD/TolR family protein [Armatimonadota bacterium]